MSTMECLQLWGPATSVWSVVLTLTAMWLGYHAVGMLHTYVLTPLRITRAMQRQGVRGPPAYWVLGNIPQRNKLLKEALSKDMEVGDYDILHRVLPDHVEWTKQYGKTHLWWLGPEPRVTITDPEMIKELLSSKSSSFEKSPLLVKASSALLGKGLVSVNGEEWALHRRVISPAFQHDRIKNMVGAMVESAAAMLGGMEKTVQEGGGSLELDVQQYMVNVTADIISRTAFGSSYEKGKKVFEQQRHLATLLVARATSPFLFVPGFRTLPTPRNRKIAKAQKEVVRSLTEIIQARKENVEKGQSDSYGSDLLGLMLSAADEEMSLKGGKVQFGMQPLVDECKTFFFAGHETTATLLTWTMMLLGRHTEWQDRARDEVLEVCGDASHPPSVDAIGKLKIVNMILQEALRLFPPVANLNREACTDVMLGDLFLPKGTNVYVARLAVHHDPELWGEDVLEFKPDRFANGAAKASKHLLAFMPFSFGPRFCVGQSFSLQEAKVVLAMLLQRFRFHLSPRYRHAPRLNLTVRPQYGMLVVMESLAEAHSG